MAAAYDALDDDTRTEIEELVYEHSQMYSRQQYGFLDFTDDERVVQACPSAPGARASRHGQGRYFSPRMPVAVRTGQSRSADLPLHLIEHATSRVCLHSLLGRWRYRDVG